MNTFLSKKKIKSAKAKSEIKKEDTNLLLPKEVTDLNGLAVTADGSVDGKMSIHEPHLVPETSGHTGDEVIDVAKSGSDGCT